MSVIIVDSMFGNTARVAEAVAQGLGGDIPLIRIAQLRSPRDVLEALDIHATGLLVLGGPTMHRGMSPRLADTLGALEGRLGGLQVAVFDTRLPGPGLLMGSAAKQVAGRIRAAGAHLLMPPEGFYVRRVASPSDARARPEDVVLIEGEIDRARAWGARLGDAVDAVKAA